MQLIVVDPLRFVKMPLSSLAGISIVVVVVVICMYIFCCYCYPFSFFFSLVPI